MAAIRSARARPIAAVVVAVAALLTAACSTGGDGTAPTARPATTAPTQVPTTSPPTSATRPPATTPATRATPPAGAATAAPAWLGTRVLRRDRRGFADAGATPAELRERRIVTVDELPPPPDGRFAARVTAVPTAVLDRSTWSAGCPVTPAELRYVTVSFRGFDGLAHTGELLVHRDVARGVADVFRRLFAAGYPIERMRITTTAELDAPPTGDGNTTGAFVCRSAVGRSRWSEHAYGRAIDVNPFQNPYLKGSLVLPELASAYTDRDRSAPGMIAADGPVVRAFRAAGWVWGGGYRSSKDWMHFSTSGR